jgi:hypothetical protein
MTELDLESFDKTASKGKRSVNREIHAEAKTLQELLSGGWNIEETDEFISSGYNNLDECLGNGFTAGNMYSFVGKTNSSKSSFLMNLVRQMCKTNTEKVKEEWLKKYPESGATYASAWPEEILKSIVDFKCKDSLLEWSKTQGAYSSRILGAFNHWEAYQQKNVNSFLYFDKEYTIEKFYRRFFEGCENTVEEANYFSNNYSTFYHKQFDEQHQSGWYYKWISDAIDNLFFKNIKVLFFDGVQCPILFQELAQIARDYNCVVITTSTLKPDYQSKDHPSSQEADTKDIIQRHSSFVGILKKEKYSKAYDSLKLFVIKNRHKLGPNFLRMVTYKNENGKQVTKSNFVLFKNKNLVPELFTTENLMLSNNIVDSGNLQKLVEKNVYPKGGYKVYKHPK